MITTDGWLPEFASRLKHPGAAAILVAASPLETRDQRIASVKWGLEHPQYCPNHHVEFLCARKEDVELLTRYKVPASLGHPDVDQREFITAVQRAYRLLGLRYDAAFDMYHVCREPLLRPQPMADVFRGGDAENREALEAAKTEPHRRKFGANARFWEHSLPCPVTSTIR